MTELQRGLKSRHISMIALGGSIGTGIFLGSGNAIYTAGPGGAILGFLVVGVMIYFLMTSLGEMAALYPVTGSFCEYCTRFVNPAFGFAMSYNYWFNWAITVAVDLSAAGIIMQFWFPHIPVWYWSGGFLGLIVVLNLFSVGLYGELEYAFSAIKITTVIIFIIIGLLMIAGMIGHHQPFDLSNWTRGDAPFHQGWYGIMMVMMVAGFSFQGTEIFGVTAGEAKNPRESIPKAIKSIFWRILVFYILAMIVINFIIPYTDPSLVNSDNKVSLSPFTIVFKEAGLTSAASILNGVILTAILSAANASMYTSTRTLWYMAKRGIAPRIFGKVTGKGVPFMALMVTSIIGAITFLTSLFGSGKIFIWLVNISSLSGFIAWLGIAISHYQFRKTWLAQGNTLEALPFRAKFFPIGIFFTVILCSAIMIGQIMVPEHLNWESILSTFINIPVFIALYLGYRYVDRARLLAPDLSFDRAGSTQ